MIVEPLNQALGLNIRGPERIALTGPNGAGRSTLLRIVSGNRAPSSGSATLANGRVAYHSQRLDLLDPERTVAQSLADFTPTLGAADRMNLLARFLFRGPHAHLPVGVLSGGERLRATLACILYAEPAPPTAAARRTHQQPRPDQRQPARERPHERPGRDPRGKPRPPFPPGHRRPTVAAPCRRAPHRVHTANALIMQPTKTRPTDSKGHREMAYPSCHGG